MKTVFSNHSEVAHIWAQRPWRNGGSSTGRAGNIFFSKDKIYSYGYHYCIGEFLDFNTVLINDSGYSVSTSKHIGIVRDAVSHKTQYFVSQTNPEFVAGRIQELIEKFGRARKPEMYYEEIKYLVEKFVEFHNTEFSNIDKRTNAYRFVANTLKRLENDFEGVRSELRERLKIERKRRRAEKQKAIREFKAYIKTETAKFLNYETNQISKPWNSQTLELRDNLKDVLRVSKDATKVETSQGISVGIDNARTLYRMIQAGIDIRGERIEHYTVTSINGTLKIGCHNIDMQSVHKVGEQINSLRLK